MKKKEKRRRQEEIAKVWAKFLDEEKQKALLGETITKDLRLNRVEWVCPNCGQDWILEMPRMKYVLNWNYTCKNCQYVEDKEVDYHFFKS